MLNKGCEKLLKMANKHYESLETSRNQRIVSISKISSKLDRMSLQIDQSPKGTNYYYPNRVITTDASKSQHKMMSEPGSPLVLLTPRVALNQNLRNNGINKTTMQSVLVGKVDQKKHTARNEDNFTFKRSVH